MSCYIQILVRPKKENVLFPVTLPTLLFWGLLKLFLKTLRIFKSIFRLFLRISILFPYKKVIIKKKFAHLLTLKILDM